MNFRYLAAAVSCWGALSASVRITVRTQLEQDVAHVGVETVLSKDIHASIQAAGVGSFDFGSFASCAYTALVPAFDITVIPLI